MSRLSPTTNNVSEELSRLTLDIAKAQSEGAIYAMLAQRLPKIIPADRCSVALLNKSTGDVEVYALHGHDGLMPIGTHVPLDHSFIGQAITERKTYHHEYFEKDTRIDAQLLHQQGLKCCINAPIHFSQETIGTINLASYEEGIYSSDAIDLLSLVTSIVSTNLERQRLLEQAQSNIQDYKSYTGQLE